MEHRYTIAYAALPLGKHQLGFTLDNDFFAHFEHSEITEGKADIQVEADKLNDLMRLWVTIEGEFKINTAWLCTYTLTNISKLHR